jgi:hypothetical protein
MRPGGQTNIWGGLHSAMETLRLGAADAAAAGRLQTVFLLTDGQPNVMPTATDMGSASSLKGQDPHVTAMQHYFATHPGFKCAVRTFGFGYALDSRMLLQVAQAGNGTFAFIPVAPVLGTVFVHAMANTLSMFAPAVTVTLAPEHGAAFPYGASPVVLPGGSPAKLEPYGLTVPVGPVLWGQVQVRVPQGWRIVSASCR